MQIGAVDQPIEIGVASQRIADNQRGGGDGLPVKRADRNIRRRRDAQRHPIGNGTGAFNDAAAGVAVNPLTDLLLNQVRRGGAGVV